MREYSVLAFEDIRVLAKCVPVVLVVGIDLDVSIFAESLLPIEHSGVSVQGYHLATVDIGLSCDDVFFHATPVRQSLAELARHRDD